MKIDKLSHVAVAVSDLSAQIEFYRDRLGLRLLAQEEVADQGVRVAIFEIGDTTIELLEPLSSDSPLRRQIEKRGEGLHHLAYQVTDLCAALAELQEQNVKLIDKAPRKGAHNMQIAFLHPKATGGVLTELCEPVPPLKKAKDSTS